MEGVIHIAKQQKKSTVSVTFTVPSSMQYDALAQHISEGLANLGATLQALQIYPNNN
jgi:hypothetical protein